MLIEKWNLIQASLFISEAKECIIFLKGRGGGFLLSEILLSQKS